MQATRTRINFDCSNELVTEAKKLALEKGTSLSSLAAEALHTFVDNSAMVKLARPNGKESKRARQARFLAAIAEVFHLSTSCRATGIDQAEVREWLTDADFTEKYQESMEEYVEGVEEKLVALGEGKARGQVLALIAFLNSHHPAYGRLKIEQISKLMGAFIDRCFDCIRVELGDETGNALVKKLKQEADLRLSVLTQ